MSCVRMTAVKWSWKVKWTSKEKRYFVCGELSDQSIADGAILQLVYVTRPGSFQFT